VVAFTVVLASCGGGGISPPTASGSVQGAVVGTAVVTPAPEVPSAVRAGFLGAFFRPSATPPYGVLAASVVDVVPSPYPTPGNVLFGSNGYCTGLAQNGVSIMTGYPVDATKLSDIVNLGVKWTRTGPAPFNDDLTHVYGAGAYRFADFDSPQCSLAQQGITPLISIDAGPVIYNSTPGQFTPQTQPIYETASDFGQWCTAIATHESKIFPGVVRYSLPGNEVNANPQAFPGGNAQIAQYSEACYAAIKAVQPASFIYGFELNMDPTTNPMAFVQQMYALGCKQGTCYDGLSLHLSLTYPLPPAGTPCYPQATVRCITDIQLAAQSLVMHVIIGEMGYFVPSSVPNETTKASAIVAAMTAFANDPFVDLALYDNVDECASYPSGYFMGGCLINTSGNILPGYTALASLAKSDYQ
jgi:hypothetical protein